MALIDLGDTAAPAPPAAAPVNLPRLRRTALAGLTVAGLLAVGASAAPAPAPVRTAWTATFRPSDTMAIDGRTVYLNRDSDAGPTVVTAYDLATGRQRWSTPAGDGPADRGVRTAGDVVLVSTETPGPGTIALDAATGAELWRANGDARPSAASGDVLLAGTGRLRLVRLRDGREVWRHPLSPADQWTMLTEGGRPSTIVTVSAQGDATVYRYADGEVLHRGRIPWNGVYSAGLTPAGPYLVVVRTASAQTVATVYRPADLRPLWRTGELIGSVTGCGVLICAAGVRGVAAHDAATGREVWRRDDMTYVWDLGGGRLLLSAADPARTALADTATGRAVGRPLDGQPVTDKAGSILLLRATGTPVARTAVTRVDLATGRTVPLGTIGSSPAPDCRGAPGHLLCARDDTLTVTLVTGR
ncbi:PQQ-binding-like beta-propeller repeat protein [Actinoplanes sp. NPDC048796]|uniref:outer membrane protein assembly factor BamB family protein n=1 Tax=unclassified Actinoplanes TaxID=2626549 RepID=UPI0033EA4790